MLLQRNKGDFSIKEIAKGFIDYSVEHNNSRRKFSDS